MKRIINYLLPIFIFFIPFQTRWIYASGVLNGEFWEYGTGCYYGTEILFWFIVLLFLIDQLRSKEFWQQVKNRNQKFIRKFCFFVFLFFCFLALVLWHSLDFWISLQYIERLLGAACLAMIIVFMRYRRQINSVTLAIVFWAGGVLQGFLAIWQFFTQSVFANKWLGMAAHYPWQLGDSVLEFSGERWLRAYGSFGSPNSLGIYLAVGLVVGLILYTQTKRRYFQILLTLGQLAIFSGLIFSFSRGAWIAALVGIITIIVLSCKDKLFKLHLKNIIFQIIYYSLLLTLYFLLFTSLFFSRFNFANRLEARSVNERVSQLSTSYKLTAKSYLLGVGPGTYTLALYNQDPTHPASYYQPVHNIYMLILVEWGVVIFSIFCFSIFLLIKKIRRDNKIFLPILMVLLITGLFDHWLISMFSGLVCLFLISGFSVNAVMGQDI
ncbi:MAG: O-antigen ligase family protein [Candidatus Magasanikbacteria bacterium]